MEFIQGTLTTLSVFGILCQSAITEASGVIRNGTVWHDTNGDEIWCNGGHVIREGDIFYWIGYETRPGQHLWNTKLYSSSNRRAGKKLKALHITDSIGEHDDHILPHGAGTVDWKAFVAALYEVGYEGLFNFEVPRENRCPMEIRLAKLDYARKLGELMLDTYIP